MAEKYQVIVIGSGPGGYVAAIRAAQLGLKTAVIEKAEIGGICLNWGCIPTKALLHSAGLYQEIKRSSEFGINTSGAEIDFAKLIKQSRTVAARLSKGVEFLFKKNKVNSIPGNGKIIQPGRVEVSSNDKKQIFEAENIIVATGARPRALPGIEFDGERVINSKEAMILKKQPQSMVIIGAGPIGAEFAYFYSTIGTKVTLVEMMPQILPNEDREVVEVVARSFKKQGIEILIDSKVERLDKSGKGVSVQLASKSGNKAVSAEVALVAIGVQGNVEALGLEECGVKVEKSFVKVDKKSYRTDAKGIYAIGDVIGPPWLAHVAFAEGTIAAEGIAGKAYTPLDYDNVPGCTYCQPQVASLGLTEEKAKALGLEIKVGRFPFRANGKSLAMGHTDGFAKLIFDARYGELLGAHIVGAEATEMLAELGVAKTLETTADELFGTIHAHPTISEVIKEAAEDAYGMAIHI
jgi:dihydrolipoamide dehydrogenase